jgi:hypothetical protein
MKVMWCWRCKMNVPMLDEEEFAVVERLYSEGWSNRKEFYLRHNILPSKCPINEFFLPVRDAYEQMTGLKESNHNAIMHHRIALYGLPCERCGKPLRTPRAKFCAACGQTWLDGN